MAKKKLLTLDNLYNFYLNQNKTCTFSAKESGYQVSVQIPTKFEISDETHDDTLLFCTVKLMHSGENRNHSCVTDEALYKAGKNLAYKPILANFMEYVDAETGETLKDFTSHDMEINDDGTVTYYEKQIGCFTADEPYYEVEEETGHNFLYGKCAIPVEYTDAYSIIKRKNGTKVSAELLINEMQYNAQSKVLELTDVIIQGATCLGKNPENLQDVGEGMLNARLDIADFSAENNSVKFSKDDKLIELLDKLNVTLSNFNNNTNGKEETRVEMNENFDEVTETEKVTETEETTEEEVTVTENESEETVDETSGDETVDEENSEKTTDESDEETEDDESTVKEDNACGGGGSGTTKKKKKNNSIECSYEVDGETKKFAVSLQEKIYAIQDLVNATYAEADNTYYGVSVYEDYVVMCDYWSGRYYKQSYTSENDNYSLTGDRVEVYAEFVTSDEQKELDAMRSNYASLKEFKENAEKNELHAKREEILNSEKYEAVSETEAFKELVKNMDNYSLEELEKEAKIIFADNFNMETFAVHAEKAQKNSTVKVFANVNKSKKDSRYGNLFSK